MNELSTSPVVPSKVLVQNWKPISVNQFKLICTQPLWQQQRHATYQSVLKNVCFKTDAFPSSIPCNIQAMLMVSPDCSQPRSEQWRAISTQCVPSNRFWAHQPGQDFLRTLLESGALPMQSSSLPFTSVRSTLQSKGSSCLLQLFLPFISRGYFPT